MYNPGKYFMCIMDPATNFLTTLTIRYCRLLSQKALDLEDRNARKAMAKTALPELLMSSEVLSHIIHTEGNIVILFKQQETKHIGQGASGSCLHYGLSQMLMATS
jgi:hypothetical protein